MEDDWKEMNCWIAHCKLQVSRFRKGIIGYVCKGVLIQKDDIYTRAVFDTVQSSHSISCGRTWPNPRSTQHKLHYFTKSGSHSTSRATSANFGNASSSLPKAQSGSSLMLRCPGIWMQGSITKRRSKTQTPSSKHVSSKSSGCFTFQSLQARFRELECFI